MSEDGIVISHSLLVIGPVPRCYSLEMDEYLGPEGYADPKEPAPKKPHKKLSLLPNPGKENDQTVIPSHLILMKPSIRRWLRVLFLKIPVRIQTGQ